MLAATSFGSRSGAGRMAMAVKRFNPILMSTREVRIGSDVCREADLNAENTFIQILSGRETFCSLHEVENFCRIPIPMPAIAARWHVIATRSCRAARNAGGGMLSGSVLEARHIATVVDLTYLRAQKARRYRYWIH